MMVVLGKNKIGKLVPRNSGKELCRWTPQTGQTVKIFVPYLNIHQWVSTAEQALNQVDKIMCSVAISQLLSQTQCFLFALMNKVAMVAGMEVMPGFNKMNFPLPKLTMLKLLLVSNTESSTWQLHWRDQPLNYQQTDYIALLPSQRRQIVILTRTDVCSGYGFASLPIMPSP